MALSSTPTEVKKLDTPNWVELPKDVTFKILQLLGAVEIVMNARQVCPMWRNICMNPSMWKSIELIKGHKSPYDLERICMYAVHHGCNHVEEINLEFFATDKLIRKISERTSNLRRIRISKCLNISNKVFIDAAKKFPLLEELELSFNNLNKESLEAIGKNCPLLRTLKFNRTYKGINCPSYKGFKCNKEALAIAKTMPRLQHLELWGNKLTDEGLIAILDACPDLQSLDIRMCYNIVMRGDLAKRCYENIKNFRHPGEYIEKNDVVEDDFVCEYYCECRPRSSKTRYMDFSKFHR
ncbi:unnamed protein product [Lathyrus sativus]|nr:unnamed protein product [Lathyrus sativus]